MFLIRSLTRFMSVAADHVMGIVPFLRHILFPPANVDSLEVLPPTKPVRALPLAMLASQIIFSSSRLASTFMGQLACAPLSALSLR